MVTIEYLPAGERLDHWQELVTTQYFPELQKQATLKQFSNVIMENLKKIANPEITILEETLIRLFLNSELKSPVILCRMKFRKSCEQITGSMSCIMFTAVPIWGKNAARFGWKILRRVQ